jgi:hypothetical protein
VGGNYLGVTQSRERFIRPWIGNRRAGFAVRQRFRSCLRRRTAALLSVLQPAAGDPRHALAPRQRWPIPSASTLGLPAGSLDGNPHRWTLHPDRASAGRRRISHPSPRPAPIWLSPGPEGRTVRTGRRGSTGAAAIPLQVSRLRTTSRSTPRSGDRACRSDGRRRRRDTLANLPRPLQRFRR